MPRYRLTLAYDGTDFHGWQRQSVDPEHPGALVADDPPGVSGWEKQPPQLRTVQYELQQAVRHVVREPVNVMGASRTDAGVHAQAQTAAFTCSDAAPRPPDDRLLLAINARLPGDALVTKIQRVREDFDPISDCIEKGYRYTIATGWQRPLWDRRTVAHIRYDMDPWAMAEACTHIEGEHDFAAFAAAGHGRETTVRTVTKCAVTAPEAHRIVIDVAGNGFLYNMVRIIAGTLVEVGRGKIEADDIPAILESKDRSRAGSTLPPEGLMLMWMRYPDDEAAPTTVGGSSTEETE
jgi:tRNA pseudouridine38-40 synthase